MRALILLTIFTLVLADNACGQLCGQDYGGQVAAIHRKAGQLSGGQPRLLLVGSSTIRFWPNAEESFPDYRVVNAGFGGSCYSDLWLLRDMLIFAFQPDALIIYEGDNDLNDRVSVSDILTSARLLFDEIRNRLPNTKVVVVAPKPSLARQQLSENYQVLNDSLGRLTAQKGFSFLNLWSAMHRPNGVVNEDLFIADGLHMNQSGYDLWVTEMHRQLSWLAPEK